MSTPTIKAAITTISHVPRGLEQLVDADEETVRIYYSQLVESRDAATADLREQVFRNYGQFVVISKEITNILLESDMLMLRDAITELKDIGEELSKEGEQQVESHSKSGRKDRSSDKKDKTGTDNQSDETPAEMRWMGDLSDELDVYIAHREFDDAVECVENGNWSLFSTHVMAWEKEGKDFDEITDKIKERSERLSTTICEDFKNPLLTRQQLQQRIQWLLRIGYNEKARSSFLFTRTALIRERTRNLTVMLFTLIKHSCSWYNQLFQDTSTASEFMKWVQLEMDFFAEKFRRRVFFDQQPFDVIAECIKCALTECAKLQDIGLDISFLLEQLLVKNLSEAIELYEKVCTDTLTRSLLEDRFRMTGVEVDGSTAVQLTSSTAKLYKLINDFSRDMSLLSSVPIYNTVVSSISTIIERYLKHMLATCEELELDDQQRFGVLADAGFVQEYFLPRIIAQVSKMFHRPAPELQSLRNRLGGFPSTLQEVLCVRKAAMLLRKAYPFASVDYSQMEPDDNFGKPTKDIHQLIHSLHKMALEIRRHPLAMDAVMANVLEEFFRGIGDTAFWETDKEPRKFGYAGVQQFVLDIHFLLKVCDAYISDTAASAGNVVCERALRLYFAQNRHSKRTLQTGDWYDTHVNEAIQSSGKAIEVRRFGEEAI
ncbi:Cullin repeat-like-containing domain protein [Syncephalis fuscata]|nr:Cullin repeat-like-containing domain protein [Syncephalis fuscata]